MKVTILYPGGKLGKPTTGGQVYDFNLFKMLHDEGVELDYLCDEELGRKKEDPLWLFSLKLIRNVRCLAKNQTLIFNTALFPYYLFPFCVLKLLYPKVRLFGIHHHFRFQEQTGIRRKIYKVLEFVNLKQCTKVICPCPYTRDVMLRSWKSARYIDLENSFDITPKSISKFEPGRLLFVGSIYPRKGILYLLEALAGMKPADRKTIRLDIVGNIADYSYYYRLLMFCQQHGLEENVKFHGIVSQQELERFYSQAYAFVFPSLLEGYGLVLIEAMSYGLPVIAFNNSAMPYTIKNEVNGLLVTNCDSTELGDKILWLMKNVDYHRNLSQNALKTSLSVSSIPALKALVSQFIRMDIQ